MERAVVYCKRDGEPLIPVTVRVEWLPDGTIYPRLFWMPDGCCFQIKRMDKAVYLAFLKDQDVGIRFKVRAELIDMPETDDGLLHTHIETYLYLRSSWFNGKNYIDQRYNHSGKEYIPVTLDIFPDCDYELVYFRVKEARYMVEKTIAIEPRGSYHAGGVGLWHKVEARKVNDDNDEDPDPIKSYRRLAALYFEVNKWFVSIKSNG